ncbi:MAG: hypothetical protein FWF87_06330 [Synergistaceae bacterium]|nr:hypothetical protein [Synergistaceae bacterium]
MASVLETIMLICFGFAWPFSIMKSWQSRTAEGKSLLFLIVILAGYIAGVLKVLVQDGITGFLLIPYSINLIMVWIDTMLYFRNKRLDKERA